VRCSFAVAGICKVLLCNVMLEHLQESTGLYNVYNRKAPEILRVSTPGAPFFSKATPRSLRHITRFPESMRSSALLFCHGRCVESIAA
jgi:hypothetical protein